MPYKIKHLETLFIKPWKREGRSRWQGMVLFISPQISLLFGVCDFPRIIWLQKTYTYWGVVLWEEEQRDLWSCSVLVWAEVTQTYLTTWLKGWWKWDSPSATMSHHAHMPFFGTVVVLRLCCTEAISKILHFSLCCSECMLLSYFGTSLLSKQYWSSIIFYLKCNWNNCMSEKNIVHKYTWKIGPIDIFNNPWQILFSISQLLHCDNTS